MTSEKHSGTVTTSVYDFSVLRTLRRSGGFTIDELSARSGVSSPVISKLERNRVSPTLETLFRIGKALGLNATDLVRLAERPTTQVKTETAHASDGFTFRETQYQRIRILYGSAGAGGRTSQPHIHRDDYETCWVLEGKVRFTLPAERHELAAGQVIQFDAVLQHTYEALEDSRLIIVHTAKEKRF